MAGQFKGRVAIVTGGSSGIGRAGAIAFAREGAKVVVAADRNVKGGQETVQMIKKVGEEATFVKTDVAIEAEVKAMVDKTIELYGRLDYAFNNAGLPGGFARGPITEITEEVWDRSIGVNLKGIWLCMKYEIPRMVAQGGGAIVNTSSVAGLRASAGNPVYTAGKHGVTGLTRAAAAQFAEKGIRINAVCPGYTGTEDLLAHISKENLKAAVQLTPMGRLAKTEEVAEAAIWLCSDAASFVDGHCLVVDGGMVA